jgi:hypothetical protein
VEEPQRLEDFHQQYKTQLHALQQQPWSLQILVSNQKMKTNPITKPNQNEVSNYSDFAMQKLINASQHPKSIDSGAFIKVVFTSAV